MFKEFNKHIVIIKNKNITTSFSRKLNKNKIQFK